MSDSPPPLDIPLINLPASESHIPFLTQDSDLAASKPTIGTKESTSSKLTSSDKLSELPSTPSPPVGYERNATRAFRQSPDGHTSHSLPASLHPSPQLGGNAELTPGFGHSVSEGSVGTTRARVSFGSDRSLPSFSHVKQATVIQGKLHRSSDSSRHGSPAKDIPPITGIESPSSHSQSRTNSPLRNLFRRPGVGHRREEPFIPVDPWQLRLKLMHLGESRTRFGSPSTSRRGDGDNNDEGRNGESEGQRLGYEWCEYDSNTCCCCLPSPLSCPPSTTKSSLSVIFSQHFLTDILPRQLYLHFLLRLPSLYFSRVARIFEDAEVSRPDIQRMIDACNSGNGDRPWSPAVAAAILPMGIVGNAPGILGSTGQLLPYPADWSPPIVSPTLARFKNSWEAFIDSLLREWKTLNVVSALLLSAILTIFQVNQAASDPITRNAAFLSLICALMSLSYGCMYIIRFGTMRSMFKASRWAEEARKTYTSIWWNVWVLLAMPAVWLSWSMLLFVVTILSFVWRTGSTNDPAQWPGLSPTGALGPRIAVSAVLVLGLWYFVLIVRTLQRYGGPRYRKAYWRPGGTDGVGSPLPASGNATGVGTAGSSSARERERGDGEQRGRERERVAKGGRSNREQEMDRQRKAQLEQDRNQEREREKEYESEGRKDEYGKEKGPSGLRKGWGLGLTEEIEENEAKVGTSDEAALEKESER